MITEQEAKESLDAVFASCVASQVREGVDIETAMRNTYNAIEKQLKDSVAKAKELKDG